MQTSGCITVSDEYTASVFRAEMKRIVKLMVYVELGELPTQAGQSVP